MSDEFSKIKLGLASLRQAFAYAGVNPAILELATPDDGYRLLKLLDMEHKIYVEPGMNEDGESRNQTTIMGIIVRWPTHKIALRTGGWEDLP